jgi:hypothetical protein
VKKGPFLLAAAALALGGTAVVVTRRSPYHVPDWLLPIIQKHARENGLDWQMLAAVIKIESDYGRERSVALGLEHPDHPDSVSWDKQSYGLGQLTPPTAARVRVGGRPYTRKELNNPETSVRLAARFLKELKTHYFKDLEGVIRGYNGGPGWRLTEKGRRDTAIYWERFQLAHAKIKELYP